MSNTACMQPYFNLTGITAFEQDKMCIYYPGTYTAGIDKRV